MTEKRFTAVIYEDYEKSLFFDNEGEERSLTDYEILKLLNELNEELESKEKAHTRCDELYRKLYDENEELKKEVKQLKNKIKTYNSTHELLKKTIDRLRNNG